MGTSATPPPQPDKHLVIFLRGMCVHTYWRKEDVAAQVGVLGQVRGARSGQLHLLDGRGAQFWLEVDKIDGWMVKDIEPTMGQELLRVIEKAQQPPDVPGDEWKKG